MDNGLTAAWNAVLAEKSLETTLARISFRELCTLIAIVAKAYAAANPQEGLSS